MKPVEIEFFKPERRRYRSVLHRRDGRPVSVEQLADACRALRETSVRWRDLGTGEALGVVWRLPPPR